ncbi:MAG: hypothetical protein IBX62_03810 [Coriobacteriia bacterium]|nr:hypothetical protein [Coriobacteriia bacterium]
MSYGSRRIRRAVTGAVVAAMLGGLGMLASAGLPEAEAAGAPALELPAAEEPGPRIALEPADRGALDKASLRKAAPLPATVQSAVTIGGGTRAASTAAANKPSAGSKLAQARAILAGLIRKYPILKGTTVTIGETPNGYQAVAYYQSGRIVINPNHKASLETILNHEVWHIIDWRDNGRIDWGENVPPK